MFLVNPLHSASRSSKQDLREVHRALNVSGGSICLPSTPEMSLYSTGQACDCSEPIQYGKGNAIPVPALLFKRTNSFHFATLRKSPSWKKSDCI